MDIRDLTFMITDRCTAACDICCFQCSPRNSFVMDESVMIRYIDEAGRLGTVDRLCFTGGEALMYPDLVKRMMRYGKEKYGFFSTLVSNGFWAANYEKGLELITELKECGLKAIRLSTDLYHQKYVPPETFRKALRILKETGLLLQISVLDTRGGPNIRAVLENLRPEIYSVPQIHLYPLVLPEKTCANTRLDVAGADLMTPCAWDECTCIDSSGVVLFSDGYIYCCCSHFISDIPRVRLGKTGELTLEEAQKKINRDPVLDLLRRDSVSWFARKAMELDPDMHFKENYTVPCELCRELLQNRELMRKLTPLAREEVWKRRMEKLMGRGLEKEDQQTAGQKGGRDERKKER